MADREVKICLNMIVKNETPVLDRLFRSVRDYISYWVIVDTGSTDGTQAFIRQWFRQAGIPGELHERPWVNFGHNRQEALELAVAADQADWLLFIDADEEFIVTDPEMIRNLEPGLSYRIEKHHGEIRYQLPLLVNVRASAWCWQAPVHEYLQHLSGPSQFQVLEGAHVLYRYGEGARSTSVSTEQKYLGDARMLREHLAKNPQDARSQFYLANSYKDAGHPEKAYRAYRKRAGMVGFVEETFMAQLGVGRMAILLGKEEQVVLRELLKAFEFRPRRAEPLHELARYFRERKKFAQAYVFAKTGSQMARPEDILFVSHEIYSWRLLDELAVSAYWIGNFEESRACCEEILRRSGQGLNLRSDDIERVQRNLAFADAKLSG